MSDRLHELISQLSLRQGERFVLSSGRESTHYFDMKVSVMHAECGHLIAQRLVDAIHSQAFDYLVGIPIGGLPLAARVMEAAWPERDLPGLVVRDKPKQHGTGNQIEGVRDAATLAGKSALIVEDVTTTGGSILKGIDTLRAAGMSVSSVVTVVLREKSAIDRLAEAGVDLTYLYHESDFV